ncbi:MAG: trypsin-like peptidase domain-containing protein [Kiritimatiellae bacterium]|nr:trypsin-like peptidase domain-containing protein [Kiritimatiellia bacterium]
MNKNTIIAAIGLAACLAISSYAQEEEEQGHDPLNAIVLLEVSTTAANVQRPWQELTGGGSGSGAVIGDGFILTCAHCVSDAAYIRVRKHNEDNLYHGSVAFIDNDADLALVKVEDPVFMRDIDPMEIGETPHVQDDVLAIGYPIGGTDISFTRGIVSRIEDIRYSHGWTWLLGIQVDAAINPGNSGGPVIDMNTGKIAGIAFQGKDGGESLGYMIPPDIIRHFLADIEDGRVDGFSDFLFAQGFMESPSKRRYYKMGDDRSGVIVEDVAKVVGDASIKTDDIIIEIDGYKVSNNGKIRIDGNEPRSIFYPIYLRQIGEQVPLKVLRDGAVVETSIPVAKRTQRVRRWMYDTKPDYFVFGGLVFTTASYNYMVEAKPDFHDDIFEDKEFEDDEAVVISDILSDVCMEGYLGCLKALVRTVNGTRVKNIRHLMQIVDSCQDGFIRLGLDMGDEFDFKMVVDAKELHEATPRIMQRYQIPADRSKDLQQSPLATSH